MSDDDWLVMLRCCQDKGLYVEHVNRATGQVLLCGPCSACLPCPRHPRAGHHTNRPWPDD